ncbi:hypothetical protein ABPG75_006166 [Micractinium tetrahymenae]
MHITIYQTASRLYCVRHAHDAATGEEEWRVLKLDRRSVELQAAEDPTPYTRPQLQRLLAALHAGNQAHGGLQMVCEAHAIVGCLRFLEGPYLMLITRRRYLGTLCGHKVHGIEATALLPVLSPSAHRALFGSQQPATAEVRYRKLLAGVQLTRDFFFSYTWPIHQTVQQTFEQPPEQWADGGADGGAWASHRVWNDFLSRPLRAALGAGQAGRWVVPLAHGYFEQRPLALLGRTLQLTLVARRSRQFAGTRYLKRGVTDSGYCANDVEVEQVVEAGMDWKSGQPLLSSVVQVRGSIPLHWAQQPESSVLKPEIVLHRFDPLYQATRRHFDMLREQYGEAVCVLDLVKRVERRPRESVLGCEYATAVRYLNQRLAAGQHRVLYTAFDLSHKARTAKSHLLADLQRVQEPVLQATGIFCSGAGSGGGRGRQGGADGGGEVGPACRQHGVLRTNCIDSLDRTNVAQFTYGMLALGRQLHAMGIAESAWLDPGSTMACHLMDLWERMGHTVALQYGGSEAHATFFQRQRGDWEARTQSKDLYTTLKRFYSNAYTDADKQDAINLFLGSFEPAPGRPHLWELGSDAYLHTGRGRAPARTTSLGTGATAHVPSSASFAAASEQAAATAGGDHLASFPPPVTPALPPAPAPAARLGSPPSEGEAEAAPALVESLSTASLVSLSSDGSFAPSLVQLVEGASPLPDLRPLGASTASYGQEASDGGGGSGGGEEPTTPRSAAAAAPAPAAPPAVPSGSGSPPAALPPRAASRRSPLLSRARSKSAKLESFDKMLGRQPVAAVRLTAAPAPTKQSALGWLSPSKSSQQVAAATTAAAARQGSKKRTPAASAASAAAAAAAAATVAAAGVAQAPPGVPIPAGGLRRSNSDPSLASSLGPGPLAPQPPAVAGAVRRHVTFDSAATVLGPVPAAAAAAGSAAAVGGRLRRRSAGAGSSGLQRHSTAPTASLEELATAAAAAATAGGLAHPFGSSLVGQLVLVESSPDEQLTWSGGSLLSSLRRSSASYHSLAGLNLEGAAAAEASIKQAPPAPAVAGPAPAAKPRRISFPGFGRLRLPTTSRKPSLDGGSAASGSLAPAAAGPGAAAPSLLQPSPSLPGGGGAPEPLSMQAVVFGAGAVRRGVDTLGVPRAAPTWWLTGADPLAAMMEQQAVLHAQITRQREALATPLDPVEQRALLEQCAALMRPSWALNLSSFTQPQGTPPPAARPAAPPAAAVAPAPAAQAVPQHGLVF